MDYSWRLDRLKSGECMATTSMVHASQARLTMYSVLLVTYRGVALFLESRGARAVGLGLRDQWLPLPW